MGRPIKKQFISNTSLADQQIQCSAWLPGDVMVRSCWLQEQTGTGRFYAVSEDGMAEGMVTLSNKDSFSLIEGEACVSVVPFAGDPAGYAQVIYDNTVRLFDGRKYKWYFSGILTSEVDGANIQSA